MSCPRRPLWIRVLWDLTHSSAECRRICLGFRAGAWERQNAAESA
jgi:hypothetical protein